MYSSEYMNRFHRAKVSPGPQNPGLAFLPNVSDKQMREGMVLVVWGRVLVKQGGLKVWGGCGNWFRYGR